MFSERFVDPRLCDARHARAGPSARRGQRLVRVRRHGVPHAARRRPVGRRARKQCPAAPARARARLSVLGAGIIVSARGAPARDPARRARSTRSATIFERDARGAFPRDGARAAAAARAARAAARSTRAFACPACQTRAHVPPAVVHGRAALAVDRADRRRARDRRASARDDAGLARRRRAVCADARSAPSGSAACSPARRARGSARSSASASTAPAATRSASCSGPIAASLDDRVALPQHPRPARRRARDDRRRPRVAVADLRRRRPARHDVRRHRRRRDACSRPRRSPTRRGSPASPARARPARTCSSRPTTASRASRSCRAPSPQTRVFAETAPLVGAADRLALATRRPRRRSVAATRFACSSPERRTHVHDRHSRIPSFFDPASAPPTGAIAPTRRSSRPPPPRGARSTRSSRPPPTRRASTCCSSTCRRTSASPRARSTSPAAAARGAIDDSRRIAEFIYRNLGAITDITTTLDTHLAYQIFFPSFWLDKADQPLTAVPRRSRADQIAARRGAPEPGDGEVAVRRQLHVAVQAGRCTTARSSSAPASTSSTCGRRTACSAPTATRSPASSTRRACSTRSRAPRSRTSRSRAATR